ncbi:MAG: VIT1/CCC1 transporter family protein [Bacteroidota bacterium]|nr:VIT1/CCC1 transporter family protein [Bacteroidota bacterium]
MARARRRMDWSGNLGANDGLDAVFGIVSGMAGYSGGSDVVLVAGLAGSLASALSMGSGAYIARKSEKLSNKLIEQPEHMLKILASEELGLSESTFPNPVREAFSAGISTAIGGMIPVIPFFFTSGMIAVAVSLIISTIAHFAIGVLKTIVTGRGWLKSGAEMTAVGIITAALAYGLGMLLSPSGHIIP